MKNEDIKIELRALSETLADMPKIEQREIPDGYFESLPDATWNKMASLKAGKQKEISKVIPMVSKLIAVAASFAILFFVFKGIGFEESKNEIPVDTMVEFIMNDFGDIDEEFLFELHTESEDMADIEDEALDYILDEGIDFIDDKLLETLY